MLAPWAAALTFAHVALGVVSLTTLEVYRFASATTAVASAL